MGHIANSSHGSFLYNSLTRKESEVLPFLTPGKTKENKNKKKRTTKMSSNKKASWPDMGLEFTSGPNPLDTDIAYCYWLDLNEISIPEVTEVDILWEGGVTMKF